MDKLNLANFPNLNAIAHGKESRLTLERKFDTKEIRWEFNHLINICSEEFDSLCKHKDPYYDYGEAEESYWPLIRLLYLVLEKIHSVSTDLFVKILKDINPRGSVPEFIAETFEQQNLIASKVYKKLFNSITSNKRFITSKENSEFTKSNPVSEDLRSEPLFFLAQILCVRFIPRINLQRIAQVSLYQEFMLDDHIAADPPFAQMVERAKAGAILSSTELKKAARLIEARINQVMNACFLKITEENEVLFATLAPITSRTRSLELQSLPEELQLLNHAVDAWAIRNNTLHVYVVTEQEMFGARSGQTAALANAISNGIAIGKLPGIKSFQLTGWCASKLNADAEQGRNLLHQIQSRKSGSNVGHAKIDRRHQISIDEFNAITHIGPHAEAMMMVANLSNGQYKKIHNRISFRNHSIGNNNGIRMKSKIEQMPISQDKLDLVVSALYKITVYNNSLDGIEEQINKDWKLLKPMMYHCRMGEILVPSLGTKNRRKKSSTTRKFIDIRHSLLPIVKSKPEEFGNIIKRIAKKDMKFIENRFQDQQKIVSSMRAKAPRSRA